MFALYVLPLSLTIKIKYMISLKLTPHLQKSSLSANQNQSTHQPQAPNLSARKIPHHLNSFFNSLTKTPKLGYSHKPIAQSTPSWEIEAVLGGVAYDVSPPPPHPRVYDVMLSSPNAAFYIFFAFERCRTHKTINPLDTQ